MSGTRNLLRPLSRAGFSQAVDRGAGQADRVQGQDQAAGDQGQGQVQSWAADAKLATGSASHQPE